MTEHKYRLRASAQFKDELLGLERALFDRIIHTMELAQSNPRMGRLYETQYETDVPPVNCRFIVVPKAKKLLFYTIDEQREQVVFFHIEDSRTNPAARFDSLDTP